MKQDVSSNEIVDELEEAKRLLNEADSKLVEAAKIFCSVLHGKMSATKNAQRLQKDGLNAISKIRSQTKKSEKGNCMSICFTSFCGSMRIIQTATIAHASIASDKERA